MFIALIVLYVLSLAAMLLIIRMWREDNRVHEAMINSLMNRLSTEERLVLTTLEPGPAAPDPGTPKYITDEPYMDTAWNEYRGVEETQEDES